MSHVKIFPNQNETLEKTEINEAGSVFSYLGENSHTHKREGRSPEARSRRTCYGKLKSFHSALEARSYSKTLAGK